MADRLKVAVLASGRGSNFQALASACLAPDFPADVTLLLVDDPDAGAIGIADTLGVRSYVIDCGRSKGSMSKESSEEIYRLCSENGIGLVCLAGFMRIVKGRLLEEFSGRMMNIHPALLPSFKGLDGQKQALDYGVKVSGCTVHFVDKGIDTGPIIIQRSVPVLQEDTEESLSARILAMEHEAYPEAVKAFAEGRIEIFGRRVEIHDE
ncbi:MAG: phosphoribosylglycinamide formyltransferase [Candidatus Krumholzibacteriota bacterium]|nr:phosphoribosylglycinamide formyltransferase [Candidatus Krumholzibacteriota bacterium]